MDIHLTKESRKVLKAIYDIYRDRRKSGMSKSASTYFDSQEDGGPEICGIDDAKQELSRIGYIRCDVCGGFDITDKAITAMENTQDKKSSPSESAQSNQIINVGSGNVTITDSTIGNGGIVKEASDKEGIRWTKIGVAVAVIVGVATILTTIIIWVLS